MLINTRKVLGYIIQAKDGEVGLCRDFLFDDGDWVIRYLVVKTDKWLPGKKVMVSPRFVNKLDEVASNITVDRSRVQIESSPQLDMHAPVSRDFETAYHDHYALPYYWVGTELWGTSPDAYVHIEGSSGRKDIPISRSQPVSKTYGLKLVSEVTGYHIAATDKTMGHVKDFIVDHRTWQILFLVIHTHNWLPEGNVIVSPQWFESVDWNHKSIVTRLKAEQIKNSPRYDPEALADRNYEQLLHENYYNK